MQFGSDLSLVGQCSRLDCDTSQGNMYSTCPSLTCKSPSRGARIPSPSLILGQHCEPTRTGRKSILLNRIVSCVAHSVTCPVTGKPARPCLSTLRAEALGGSFDRSTLSKCVVDYSLIYSGVDCLHFRGSCFGIKKVWAHKCSQFFPSQSSLRAQRAIDLRLECPPTRGDCHILSALEGRVALVVRQSELLLRESFGYQSLIVTDEFVFRLRSNGLNRVSLCQEFNRDTGSRWL